jgi:hypothetical protein
MDKKLPRRLVALCQNDVSRLKVRVQMLLVPLDELRDTGVMQDDTIRW